MRDSKVLKIALLLTTVGVAAVLGLRLAHRIYSPVLSTLPKLDDSVRRRLPNIVLISIDTLRKSELGSYDPSLPTSPHLLDRKDEFIRFDQAISQAPWTGPAHLALFYSKYPPVKFWERDVVSLTSVLQHFGYTTAAFTDGGWLGKGAGIDAGFDRLVSPAGAGGFVLPLKEKGEQVTGWLNDHPSEPFFLFLHTYHTHATYDPHPDQLEAVHHGTYTGVYSGEVKELLEANQSRLAGNPLVVETDDIDHLKALYQAEIREVDEFLNEVFEELERRNLWNDAIVIVTSDHGESFFERGFFEHGTGLYDELINVPLLIKCQATFPTRSQTVDRQVELLDLGPTILELAGIDPPEVFRGKSFVSLFSDLSSSRYPKRYAFSSVGTTKNYGDAKLSVRSEEWKYILHPDSGLEELYHLRTDPEEHHNSIQSNREVAASMRALLQNSDQAGGLTPSSTQNISPEDREILQALGYIE